MDLLPNEIIVNEILPYLYLRDLHRLKSCGKRFSKLDQQNNILYSRNIKEDNNDIWQWIYPLIYKLKNYIVAGGQALRTLNRESWYGDLDIFFYNQSIEHFITQCYNLFKEICKHSDLTWSRISYPYPNVGYQYNSDLKLEDELKIKDVYLIRLSGVPLSDEPHCYSFQRRIDLVYTKYTNIKDILNDFDLPFCGVGFTINEHNFNFMMSSIECYKAAKDRQCNILILEEDKLIMNMTRDYYLGSHECNLKVDHIRLLPERIKKYEERGYKTTILNNSGGKKIRTIREKWESRQQNLMKYTL